MSERRTFEHFPENATCPLCGTNDDKECCLIPIDGTSKDRICEAKPMHVECIERLDMYRYNQDVNVLYRSVEVKA